MLINLMKTTQLENGGANILTETLRSQKKKKRHERMYTKLSVWNLGKDKDIKFAFIFLNI